MKKLKLLASAILLSLSALQIPSSQAMDTMPISLIQPDGVKRAMKLNLDQPLSELRDELMNKQVNILSDDKFITEKGEISPREEARWKIREVISGDVLSFKPRCSMSPTIPPVAQGYEDIYQTFAKGKLIYKPNPASDEGMVELRIAEVRDSSGKINPLEGTFDLSHCGDAGKYLSISTGYRKGKKWENSTKVEVWITPRFLIEKELQTTAKHFAEAFSTWNSSMPVGIFFNWGAWDDLTRYDELTNYTMDELSNNNLYKQWEEHRGWLRLRGGATLFLGAYGRNALDRIACFVCDLRATDK